MMFELSFLYSVFTVLGYRMTFDASLCYMLSVCTSCSFRPTLLSLPFLFLRLFISTFMLCTQTKMCLYKSRNYTLEKILCLSETEQVCLARLSPFVSKASAYHGPLVQYALSTVYVNKVLLKQSHTHSLTSWHPCCNGRVQWNQHRLYFHSQTLKCSQAL